MKDAYFNSLSLKAKEVWFCSLNIMLSTAHSIVDEHKNNPINNHL